MKFRILIGLLGVFVCGGASASTEPAVLAVGQAWSYVTRAGEENSSLTILAADADEKEGTIYHVAVVDLKLNRVAPATGSEPWHMTVAAFSAAALRKSVTKLASPRESLVVDGFEQEHRVWKARQAKGQHGYWKLSVAEAIAQRETMILKGKRS